MSGEATPRVNAARLANYQGRQVRLPCKIVEVKGNTALVEASDGGQVEVSLNQVRAFWLPSRPIAHAVLQEANLSEPYAEIIGRVTSANGLKMVFAINMGDNIGAGPRCPPWVLAKVASHCRDEAG
jgi:replication factor A3